MKGDSQITKSKSNILLYFRPLNQKAFPNSYQYCTLDLDLLIWTFGLDKMKILVSYTLARLARYGTKG